MKRALAFVKSAWDSVTIQTIVNCWKHVDILPKDTPLSELVDPEEFEDDNVLLAELIS